MLTEFEMQSYQMRWRVFQNPKHALCTLDDDLFETRDLDIPVKMISAREADREGHTAIKKRMEE